jgi:DnaJ domain
MCVVYRTAIKVMESLARRRPSARSSTLLSHSMSLALGSCSRIVGRLPPRDNSATNARALYYTNAKRVKQDDPYAALGLVWGATQTEIKAAFRKLAARHHPDVNTVDDRSVAVSKFQALTAAYETLTSKKCPLTVDDDAWQWTVWFRSQQIAEARTDVAGQARQRPIPPAVTEGDGSKHMASYTLGHPSGSGTAGIRKRHGEYLTNGDSPLAAQPSQSVGTGQNKWVTAKPYVAWNKATLTQPSASPMQSPKAVTTK